MKQFIKELRDEWSSVGSSFDYRYYWRGRGKYALRNFIVQLNREASAVLVQIISSPLYVFLLLGSIGLGYALYRFVGIDNLSYVFEALTGFIISFISVLVAAAIFISTLHRRATNDSMEQDKEFLGTLAKHKGEMEEVYLFCYEDANEDQRIKLFKAVAPSTVLDYSDYEAYKAWHLQHIKGLDSTKFAPFDEYIKYPYDTAMSASWNRSFYIRQGCEASDQLLASHTARARELKVIAKELQVAANQYEQAGLGFYYIPVEFVGKRLIRVVIYSLIAVSSMLVLSALKNIRFDIFPNVDFHFMLWIMIATVVFTICSIFLIIRYVFKFIAYLRDSTAYGTAGINNLYIHEPDATMRMNSDA